ncbi:MAG: hypothetical protein U0T79_09395 [Ferruginibacter sp.]
MIRAIPLLLACFYSELVYSQGHTDTIEYNKLATCKVDEDVFQFGWLPTSFREIPCFRNYTKNRIRSQFVDPKTDSIIYTSTEPEINGLKIIPSKITINKKSGLFQIVGQITGGWESVMPDEFEIYVGHRIDSVSYITLSPNLHGTIYYNGKKVTKTIIIDTVPAFHLKDFKKFNAYRGDKTLANSDYKEMQFDISAVIDNKSILVFGLLSRYAEIFEIGKLLTQ